MKRTIFTVSLIAGTMDIGGAFIHSYLAAGVTPSTVLKYIASGLFGESAFDGGAGMLFIGLAVHYFIAFLCTACFFWLYPKWAILQKSVLVNSVLIALIAWLVTDQMIIPLSGAAQGAFDLLHASLALGILIICIGLPIAYSAKQHYSKII